MEKRDADKDTENCEDVDCYEKTPTQVRLIKMSTICAEKNISLS